LSRNLLLSRRIIPLFLELLGFLKGLLNAFSDFYRVSFLFLGDGVSYKDSIFKSKVHKASLDDLRAVCFIFYL